MASVLCGLDIRVRNVQTGQKPHVELRFACRRFSRATSYKCSNAICSVFVHLPVKTAKGVAPPSAECGMMLLSSCMNLSVACWTLSIFGSDRK